MGIFIIMVVIIFIIFIIYILTQTLAPHEKNYMYIDFLAFIIASF